MGLFAVILNEPREGLGDRIKSLYPDSYTLSDTCFLISEKQSSSQMLAAIRPDTRVEKVKVGEREWYILTVEKISSDIGMTGGRSEEDILGLVVKLNSKYGGYNYPDLWGWIDQALR